MFETDKPQQDRAYNEMLKPIREKLERASAPEIAARAGGEASEIDGTLRIETLGQTVTVKIPEGEALPVLENWHMLVLLHYLCNADGTPVSGRWMSFADMKDGMIRGTKYGGTSEKWFHWFLRGKTLEEVERAALSLGGVPAAGKGDLCISIPFLPHFPVLLQVWEADEEFDASGKLLVDGSADHYLSIEDAVTVGEIVQKRLEAALQPGEYGDID